MAWQDRGFFGAGNRDHDAMGVQGEVLFADPLNVRHGSQKNQMEQRSQSPRNGHYLASSIRQSGQDLNRGPSYRQENDPMMDPQREDDEEGWGLTSFFWYVLAGGKQCCSMRDRSKQQDIDAAKKAAETGRPPKSRFPEPPKPGTLDHTFGPDPGGSRKGSTADGDRRKPEVPKFQGGAWPQRNQYDADSDSDEQFAARRTPTKPDAPAAFNGWRQPPRSEPRSPRSPRSPKALEASTDTGRALQPPPAATFPAKSQQQEAPAPAAPAAPAAGATPASSPKESPKRWEWPSWCLNFKEPCIEVFVVDEDTGVGKWVEGEPQSRVVDKAGRDAYLCVEYEWDGEYYVQDFGPQHVRRRGQQVTVFQMFEADSGKLASKGRDTGGGISAFLGD
mmetsp:Transcript_90711/g.211028  ORF Transcript_90711/g.211028 Transcript_90711/m.211028 type:complete len:391 (-) Transcript_90711:72-1244(-)